MMWVYFTQLVAESIFFLSDENEGKEEEKHENRMNWSCRVVHRIWQKQTITQSKIRKVSSTSAAAGAYVCGDDARTIRMRTASQS